MYSGFSFSSSSNGTVGLSFWEEELRQGYRRSRLDHLQVQQHVPGSCENPSDSVGQYVQPEHDE
ncbi:unnamed protein product [Fusarium venenatum]|uniref:Uncharacterized protein n=1 Tax=Fusarium venenatum TaxID=56646 RepID=A0A2L2SVZ3_9HYPO|nr:uncharacterized protein FVRRES_05065 [Fusarium venenatum]CEI60629.1 unnamed protein product [Fusarium venenatum]